MTGKQLSQDLASALRWIQESYVDPYAGGWHWLATQQDGGYHVTGCHLNKHPRVQRACVVSCRVPRQDKKLVRNALIAAEYELTHYGIREGRCTVTPHQASIMCTLPVHADGEPCWVDLVLI